MSEAEKNKKINGAPAVPRCRLNKTDIGQMIETDNMQEGVLLAPEFRHMNRQGKRVGPVFEYFAAPKDTRFLSRQTPTNATYNRDVQRIADFNNVCGHRGILLANDIAIYNAAQNNPDKLSFWHMPTSPLVGGQYPNCYSVNPDNLYTHKNKGDFRNTFTDKANFDLEEWYWTALGHPNQPSHVLSFSLAKGHGIWENINITLSSRAVRARIRQP